MTASCNRAGILAVMTSTSVTLAGVTLWTRLLDPAPRIRHGFASTSSSMIAVAKIVLSKS